MLLVTGASGLLGAALVSHAHDLGRQVVGLCHRHKLRMKNVPVHSVDLTSRTATRELIARLRPSSIVHCAAATNVDWCEDHPLETEEANVHASSFLAEVAAEMKCSLTYISTDSVFDGRRGNYSEDDQPSPLNVYAKSKLRGEQEVLAEEAGERRQAGQRQQADRQGRRQQRRAEVQPAVALDGVLGGEAHVADHREEGAELREGVGQQEEQHGRRALLRGRDHADQGVAGLGDARVRQHALDVALRERE